MNSSHFPLARFASLSQQGALCFWTKLCFCWTSCPEHTYMLECTLSVLFPTFLLNVNIIANHICNNWVTVTFQDISALLLCLFANETLPHSVTLFWFIMNLDELCLSAALQWCGSLDDNRVLEISWHQLPILACFWYPLNSSREAWRRMEMMFLGVFCPVSSSDVVQGLNSWGLVLWLRKTTAVDARE